MEELTLFKVMDAKLAYHGQRQAVLATNIANANTPGYRPQDVRTPDFKELMTQANKRIELQGLSLTSSHHITESGMDDVSGKVYTTPSYEVSPDGNAVDLEEQMLKASKNNSEAGVVIGLYAKQLSFLRTAVGAGR